MAVEESIIKAAFIEKLTRFIVWPDETKHSDDRAFTLCVLGNDKIIDALNEMAPNTVLKGKTLAIHQLQRTDEINECRSLFITSTRAHNLADILEIVSSRPILTIADSDGFASRGVMINFYFDDNRLRFEINQDAAKSVGIKVGSRVLKLARIVNSY